MLHIVLKNGFVVSVYNLGKTPNDPVITLQPEFDYKVENLDDYEIMDREGK